MINLVANALKFTQEGNIELLACYDKIENLLWVSVKDQGIGIDPSDMSSLFSKFGKLQRTAEMNSSGLGLGL